MTINRLFESKPYTLNQIKKMYSRGKLWANPNYQRNKVWKEKQRKELIWSIEKDFAIGAITIYERRNRFEILDGQQRIWAISDFLKNALTDLDNKKFNDLDGSVQDEIKAYPVPVIILNSKLNEKEISDMFVRLQEGSTLSTAEKVYAFTGTFKQVFVSAFFEPRNQLFFGKLSDKRFRARLVAAHLLAIELKSDLRDNFPAIDYPSLKKINAETKTISNTVIRNYYKNIQFLGLYLYPMLKAMRIREITPAYMLASYFRKKNVITKKYQGLIFKDFMLDFTRDLNKFSIYDDEPPDGMTTKLFQTLMAYKTYSGQALTPNSLKSLLKIVKGEFERRKGKIQYKDKKRFYSREQKIIMYFEQKWKCDVCKKEIDFDTVDAHHAIPHSKGGGTVISNGKLVHKLCHKKI